MMTDPLQLTSEEITYEIARTCVANWRTQLRRIQERDQLDLFARGVAEGLATAIRDLDRILDASPVCKRYEDAAR